jgi:hypothetical protein
MTCGRMKTISSVRFMPRSLLPMISPMMGILLMTGRPLLSRLRCSLMRPPNATICPL